MPVCKLVICKEELLPNVVTYRINSDFEIHNQQINTYKYNNETFAFVCPNVSRILMADEIISYVESCGAVGCKVKNIKSGDLWVVLFFKKDKFIKVNSQVTGSDKFLKMKILFCSDLDSSVRYLIGQFRGKFEELKTHFAYNEEALAFITSVIAVDTKRYIWETLKISNSDDVMIKIYNYILKSEDLFSEYNQQEKYKRQAPSNINNETNTEASKEIINTNITSDVQYNSEFIMEVKAIESDGDFSAIIKLSGYDRESRFIFSKLWKEFLSEAKIYFNTAKDNISLSFIDATNYIVLICYTRSTTGILLPVGYLVAFTSPHRFSFESTKADLQIISLATEPFHRQRGVATALLQHLLLSIGSKTAAALVSTGNFEAAKTFKKVGFEKPEVVSLNKYKESYVRREGKNATLDSVIEIDEETDNEFYYFKFQ